jgi:hypothetical protein
MNTQLVFDAIHGTDDVEETEEVEPEVEETEEVETEEVEAEATDVTSESDETEVVEVKPKKFRPKLTQYITNAFKEITTREPRFQGLLLGKEVTALVNNLVYQVMDRYVKVIKSLLMVGNSKTITDHLAVIATMIILQDDIHTSDEDIQVILDLVQARIEVLKAAKKEKTEAAEEVEAPVEPVVEPVAQPVVEAKKASKKKA